ncbi:MAG: hypothetical protein QXU97_04500 [Fervidicoccaceae archaeon]
MSSEECKSFTYARALSLGGLELTLVAIPGRGVVEPTKRERSDLLVTGEDVYCLKPEDWRRAWVVKLERTMAGRQYAFFEGDVPSEVIMRIRRMWEVEGESDLEIRHALHHAALRAKPKPETA